jgi:hypothetical protein
MLIASETLLLDVQEQLVSATHGLTTERGTRPNLSTIDPARLRMAALVALQVAIGEPVWPADVAIIIPRRAALAGPFREEQ